MEKTDKEIIAILTLNKVDYPILKVKEGYVVVDEKWKIKIGEYFYSIRYNTVDKLASNGVINPKECFKIIASTFPLEGVKRFEMVGNYYSYFQNGEGDYSLCYGEEQTVFSFVKREQRAIEITNELNKAAQSKGLFTEEHVLKAIEYGYGYKPVATSSGQWEKDVKQFIQSLLPRYEVEMNTVWNRNADRNVPTKSDLDVEPVTYEKEGVTYLKLKTVK
jgi:hypothetical protein